MAMCMAGRSKSAKTRTSLPGTVSFVASALRALHYVFLLSQMLSGTSASQGQLLRRRQVLQRHGLRPSTGRCACQAASGTHLMAQEHQWVFTWACCSPWKELAGPGVVQHACTQFCNKLGALSPVHLTLTHEAHTQL